MDKMEIKIHRAKQALVEEREAEQEYGPFEYYRYKVMVVHLNQVYGLMQEKIMDEKKEQEILNLVEVEGTNIPLLKEIELIYLPEGKFSVKRKDNLQLYLASKLGLEKIQAQVTILLPHKKLLSSTIKALEKMNMQRNDYKDRLDEIKLECRLQYKNEEDLIPPFIKKIRTELYDNLTWVNDKRNFLLHDEAKRLELLPDRPRLKIIIKNKQSS